MQQRIQAITAAITMSYLPIANASEIISPAWPPTMDSKNPTIQSLDGRTIERFVHGPCDAWGYVVKSPDEWNYPHAQETGPNEQNHNSFYLVAPKVPHDGAPLCVVLHSANRTGFDYLGYDYLNQKTQDMGGKSISSDGTPTSMTHSPDGFYALYLNSTNAEWWGWSQIKKGEIFKNQTNGPLPAELRVLDTIEWVVSRYKIDRNRIYICGLSMGGCGALGIGMPNGKVFAAVLAVVPAGTGYASYRMGGFGPLPAVDASQGERDAWMKRAAGIPDPPVVVDFSANNDLWSITQPALVETAQAWHLPLVLCWGGFEHSALPTAIAKHPTGEAALAFPWTEIRKNEAYPAFSHASSDESCPWLNSPADFGNRPGQLNAYFRWKNQEDSPARLAISLWIAPPKISQPSSMPERATADVTLRRLQRFIIDPKKTYFWQLSREGHPVASGQATPDLANLLTIPKLELTTIPAELSIKAE